MKINNREIFQLAEKINNIYNSKEYEYNKKVKVRELLKEYIKKKKEEGVNENIHT